MSIDLEQELFVCESQVYGHESVVYWIRDTSMLDYKKEGYIGVSNNLRHRLWQHKSSCRCGTNKYHPDMKNLVLEDNYVVEILYKGARHNCFVIESLLRPKCDIGWNIRQGGSNIVKSADFNIMKVFRNMKHQAKKRGLTVDPIWQETLGYYDFEEFYRKNCKEGSLEMKLPACGEVNKNSLTFITRKSIVHHNNRNIDFFNDGAMMSNIELSDLLCIEKPNTLVTQRKRGWSNGKIFMKAWENDKSRKIAAREL